MGVPRFSPRKYNGRATYRGKARKAGFASLSQISPLFPVYRAHIAHIPARGGEQKLASGDVGRYAPANMDNNGAGETTAAGVFYGLLPPHKDFVGDGERRWTEARVRNFIRASEAFVRTGERESEPPLSASVKARQWTELAEHWGERNALEAAAEARRRAQEWADLEESARGGGEEPFFWKMLNGQLPTRLRDRLADMAEQLLFIEQTGPGSAVVVANTLAEVTDGLSRLAAGGDEHALRALHFVAARAVQALHEAIEKQPTLGRTIAERHPTWPAFVGPHGDTRRENEDRVRNLNVGAKAALNVNARWSNRHADGHPYRAALGGYVNRVITVLEQARDKYEVDKLARFAEAEFATVPAWLKDAVRLPPMSQPDSFGPWFKAAKRLLLSASGQRPESLPGFRPNPQRDLDGAGAFRVKARGNLGDTSRTETGQMREAIFERLREAMKARWATPDNCCNNSD